jgi:DNA-binding MurR/RpiR family transcriptional regulator
MDKRIKVLETIMQDVENDAKYFDGQPFNGKTVAKYFGNHGAAIVALTNIVKSILTEKSELPINQKQELPADYYLAEVVRGQMIADAIINSVRTSSELKDYKK